ncbi:hypothetical protein BDZ45DRAFT_744777 [Acephala macrosclerotiorum]|nr:hypothetical protein BDZ45DRAFT_744777 [Acephala macrosclerotiorum]
MRDEFPEILHHASPDHLTTHFSQWRKGIPRQAIAAIRLSADTAELWTTIANEMSKFLKDIDHSLTISFLRTWCQWTLPMQATGLRSLSKPHRELTSTTALLSSSSADPTSSSIHPSATTTLYFNSTCNSTSFINSTSDYTNTTSLVCSLPSKHKKAFPFWIFYLWPLDLALGFVAVVILVLLVYSLGWTLKVLGWTLKGTFHGVESVKRGVDRRVEATKYWNQERLKRKKEREERELERKRGTIALEAIM